MAEAVSRRQFLVQLAVLGGAAVLAAGCSSGSSDGDLLSIGPASGFTTGNFTMVSLPDRQRDPIFVTRKVDGTYLALSAKCTHRGCTVAWNPTSKEFVCPCHGGKFDAAGLNVSGPPPSPLVSLATSLDGKGNLMVQPLAAASTP